MAKRSCELVWNTFIFWSWCENIFVYDRRRQKLPKAVQRATIPRFLRTSTTVDDDSRQTSATELQTATPAAGNSGLQPRAVPPPIYAKPQKRSPVSPAPAANEQSSVYSGTSTTLIDNALYRTQQQPVTSSNFAEPEDDLTVIDNDLYRREGQGHQNSGSTDYECTLIDNDLYRWYVSRLELRKTFSYFYCISNVLYCI